MQIPQPPPLARKPAVKLRPFFWNKLPWKPNYIWATVPTGQLSEDQLSALEALFPQTASSPQAKAVKAKSKPTAVCRLACCRFRPLLSCGKKMCVSLADCKFRPVRQTAIGHGSVTLVSAPCYCAGQSSVYKGPQNEVSMHSQRQGKRSDLLCTLLVVLWHPLMLVHSYMVSAQCISGQCRHRASQAAAGAGKGRLQRPPAMCPSCSHSSATSGAAPPHPQGSPHWHWALHAEFTSLQGTDSCAVLQARGRPGSSRGWQR